MGADISNEHMGTIQSGTMCDTKRAMTTCLLSHSAVVSVWKVRWAWMKGGWAPANPLLAARLSGLIGFGAGVKAMVDGPVQGTQRREQLC